MDGFVSRIFKADAQVGCLEWLTEELSKFSALWRSMEEDSSRHASGEAESI